MGQFAADYRKIFVSCLLQHSNELISKNRNDLNPFFKILYSKYYIQNITLSMLHSRYIQLIKSKYETPYKHFPHFIFFRYFCTE